MVLGEISTQAKIDFQQVVRDCIQQIGYDESNKGVCAHVCVFVSLSMCVAGGRNAAAGCSLHMMVYCGLHVSTGDSHSVAGRGGLEAVIT